MSFYHFFLSVYTHVCDLVRVCAHMCARVCELVCVM